MAEYKFSKPEQTLNAVREKYKNANGLQAANLAEWLSKQNDKDLKKVFNITSDYNLNNMKAKLRNKTNLAKDIRSLRGE